MRLRWLVFVLLGAWPGAAQFGLPKIPGLPGGGGLNIPGLDNILREEPALSTSFKDAVTGVKYYDDFEPRVDVAMAEMPRGPRHSFMLAPGGYEVVLQSYCLNAGTHGPGRGEGYLYAPLKGSLAGPLGDILDRSCDHPEISQHHVQSLLWAVEAKCKISELAPDLRAVAAKLLTPQQIDQLNGGALGKIPPELMDRAMAQAPPELRQAMHARATLRNMFSQAMPDFGAVEQVAVLAGDPPAARGEEVPRTRWSYRSGGFFVRYFPSGYQRTRTQVFVPADVDVTRDGRGRIVALSDIDGQRVEVEYDDTVTAAAVPRDEQVTGQALALVRLSRPKPGARNQRDQLECRGAGWVLVGQPSGKGRPGAAGERFAGLAERYSAAVAHQAELQKLAGTVQKVGEHPAPRAAVPDVLRTMGDLASLAVGLREAVMATNPKVKWALRLADLPRVAWGGGLVFLGEGGATPPEQARAVPRGGYHLVSAVFEGSLLTADRLAFASAWGPWSGGARLVGYGGSSGGRGLRSFSGSGTATPANGKRQRLGQSSRPDDEQDDAGQPEDEDEEDDEETPPEEDGSDKDILDRAKTAIDWIGKGTTVANLVTDPAGTIAGQFGNGIQDQMQSAFFDWVFDTTAEISKALGGDPPRPDFRTIATAEPVPAASTTMDWGPIPPSRAAALTALRGSLLDLIANLRAGQISVDRLGGALQAGDQEWATRQAEALLHHKRQSGAAMQVVADRLDAFVAELRAGGAFMILSDAKAWEQYQARIREGFSPVQLEMARSLGLSDAEIEAGRQRRLAPGMPFLPSNLLTNLDDTAASLRELGRRWERLPAGAGLE